MPESPSVSLRAAILLGLAASLAGGLLVRSLPPASMPGAPSPGLATELDALRTSLDREAAGREVLAGELEALRGEVEALVLSVRETQAPPVPEPPSVEGLEPPAAAPGSPHAVESAVIFESEALIRSGLSEGETEELNERWEQAELEKLYLADRATREGWLFSARHRREVAGIELGLREAVDDEGYDRILYATRKPNRVVVRGVLGGSAARAVGIARGDEILSYAGHRIFDPGELRRATTQGESGQSVYVELRRDGQLERVLVPRGPLGIMLDSKRRPPIGP